MPEETAPEDLEVIEEESLDREEEDQTSSLPDFSEGKLNKSNGAGDEAQIKLFDE